MIRATMTVTLLLAICVSGLAQENAEPFEEFSSRIGIAGKARIIRMTAHLKAINNSKTPVDKYIYRLTVPPNTQSQKSFIESSTTPVAATKNHKNGCNQFVEFHFPVPENGQHTIDVSFLVLLRPVNYLKCKTLPDVEEITEEQRPRWLEPSKLIESNSKEVLKAGEQVFAKSKNDATSLAKAAYQFPKTVLKFKYQKKSLGAQTALQTGIGDCTEFACLFAALCRSKEIPARRISIFNFAKKLKYSKSVPNHHIAECYLPSHGWIPVDPNLGKGKFNRPVGFGKLSNYFVIYNREGAWVWQTNLPKGGYDKSLPKPKMDYEIFWDGEVIEEGSVKKMEKAYAKAFQNAKHSE